MLGCSAHVTGTRDTNDRPDDRPAVCLSRCRAASRRIQKNKDGGPKAGFKNRAGLQLASRESNSLHVIRGIRPRPPQRGAVELGHHRSGPFVVEAGAPRGQKCHEARVEPAITTSCAHWQSAMGGNLGGQRSAKP